MKAILKKVEDFSSETSDGELINKSFIIKEQKTEVSESGDVVEVKKEVEVIEPIFIEVDDYSFYKTKYTLNHNHH